MPRKPMGESAMTETVKFRLTEEELRCLRAITPDNNLSTTLRALIQQECRGRYFAITPEE